MLKNESFRYHMILFCKLAIVYYAPIILYALFVIVTHMSLTSYRTHEDYTFLFLLGVSFYSFYESFPLMISNGYSRQYFLKGRLKALLIWAMLLPVLDIAINFLYYEIIRMLKIGYMGIPFLATYLVFTFGIVDTFLYLFLYYLSSVFLGYLIAVFLYSQNISNLASHIITLSCVFLTSVLVFLFNGRLAFMLRGIPIISWIFDIFINSPYTTEPIDIIIPNVAFCLFFGMTAFICSILSWRLTKKAPLRMSR